MLQSNARTEIKPTRYRRSWVATRGDGQGQNPARCRSWRWALFGFLLSAGVVLAFIYFALLAAAPAQIRPNTQLFGSLVKGSGYLGVEGNRGTRFDRTRCSALRCGGDLAFRGQSPRPPLGPASVGRT
jgi:hypothetical protein